MPQLEKRDIHFDSADKKHKVAGYFYSWPGVKPRLVLQVSHGMCEYIGRYEEFAAFLAQNGVVVCGNDHLGHGNTAGTLEDLGYFSQKGGHVFVLQDLRQMCRLAQKEYPGLPVVLLGHSMGSFYAREFATLWPEMISGLILSGTGGPNPVLGPGILIADMISAIKGERHRSELLFKMGFGAYLKRIPNPRTPYDWISRDTEIVDRYAADPKCTFRFTANGYHELMTVLKKVSSAEWAGKLNKTMPVMMISGDADPVGDYGKGVATVREWMSQAGVEQIDFKMYPGARHEVLNETNRQEVYSDVLAFLQKWWLG